MFSPAKFIFFAGIAINISARRVLTNENESKGKAE